MRLRAYVNDQHELMVQGNKTADPRLAGKVGPRHRSGKRPHRGRLGEEEREGERGKTKGCVALSSYCACLRPKRRWSSNVCPAFPKHEHWPCFC